MYLIIDLEKEHTSNALISLKYYKADKTNYLKDAQRKITSQNARQGQHSIEKMQRNTYQTIKNPRKRSRESERNREGKNDNGGRMAYAKLWGVVPLVI